MQYRQLKNLKWHDRFTYVKNIVFGPSDLNDIGAKFQIVKFLPHTRVKPHYHEKVYEIFYIRSGKGKFIFNSQSRSVQADDIFLCEPQDVHEIVNDGDEELIVLIFKTNENPDDIVWSDIK